MTPLDPWTVLVPLKSTRNGKSRIDVDPALRRRLALAMAMDTVAAASLVPGVGVVLAVIEDPADGEQLRKLAKVRIHRTRSTGLNRAIADGLGFLPANPAGPVAVLPGDLPSLTPDELADALAAARSHPVAVVADRQGIGSTLLTASTPAILKPRYGVGSLGRHLSVGAVLLDRPVESGLRRDVDRADDLVGVTGPRTVAVLAAAGWRPALCTARPTG